MKKFQIIHVNREDFASDRMVNEYGTKRPATSVVVGEVEAETGSKARRMSVTLFPPKLEDFVTVREIKF